MIIMQICICKDTTRFQVGMCKGWKSQSALFQNTYDTQGCIKNFELNRHLWGREKKKNGSLINRDITFLNLFKIVNTIITFMSAMYLTQNYFRFLLLFWRRRPEVAYYPLYLDGSLNVSGEEASSRPGEERSAAVSTPSQPRQPESLLDFCPEAFDLFFIAEKTNTFQRKQLVCQRWVQRLQVWLN